MVLKACTVCGKEFDERKLLVNESGPICEGCEGASTVPAQRVVSSMAILGLIAGLLPLFIRVSSSSSTTVDGVVTSSVSRDYVALGGGAVAIVAGLIALVSASRSSDRKQLRMAITAGIVLLGALQILRGLGLIATI